MARTKRTASDIGLARTLAAMKRRRPNRSGKVTGKKINYAPVKWMRKEIKPWRATIPINPFPAVYRTKITYAPPGSQYSPGFNSTVIQFQLTNLYNPDFNTAVGGGQPLFFDQLCSSTGPYKQFKVLGWRGKFTLVNLGGIREDTPSTGTQDCYEILWQQGYELSAEGDTNAELQSAPNLQRHLLPSTLNGSASQKVIYFQGRTKDFFAETVDDSTLVGNYAGTPAIVVYGSLGIRSLGSKLITMGIQVTIEFDVEFFSQDGAAS